MKKLTIILSVIFLFSACAENNENKNENQENDSTKTEEITEINLNDFDSVAADFVDVKVKISGIIDHVCKHGGKKILLVNQAGDASLHVENDVPFEDTLTGSEVQVVGIVRELIVDEAYCQQLEQDAIAQHSEGDEQDVQQSHKMQQANFYRDSMKKAGVDHLSFYTLDFVKFQ